MENKMKNTNIDCIGAIPIEWDVKPLKYLVRQPITDGPHETPEFTESGVPFLSVDGIQKGKLIFENTRFVSEYDANRYDLKVKPEFNDILLGKAASIGKVAIVDRNDRFQIWSPLAVIKTNKLLNPLFLKYYLMSPTGQKMIEDYATENTQKNIAMEDIERLKIVLPTYDEQVKIASLLDEKCTIIDEMIEDKTNQIQLLNDYKNSLVYNVVTKGLTETELINSKYDFIPQIPKGWKLKRFKYCLAKTKNNLRVGPFGSNLTSDDYTSEGYLVYNQRVVLDNEYFNNDVFVNQDKYNELIDFSVYPGDILLTTRGTIGKISEVPFNAPEGILHPCIIKFKINEDLINIRLLKILFNDSNFVMDQFMRMSNSTTIEVIYSYSLKEIILPCIPADEQERITNYLEDKIKKINSIIEEQYIAIDTLNEYKKSILYEYVTGKKQVEV